MNKQELRKKLVKLFDAGDEGIIVLDTPDMKVVNIDEIMSAVQEYVSEIINAGTGTQINGLDPICASRLRDEQRKKAGL